MAGVYPKVLLQVIFMYLLDVGAVVIIW